LFEDEGRQPWREEVVLGIGARAQPPAPMCCVSDRISESIWWIAAWVTKAKGDDTRLVRHSGLDARSAARKDMRAHAITMVRATTGTTGGTFRQF